MNKTAKIKCPHCDGEGEVALSGELAKTLAVFKGKVRKSAAQVHDALREDVSINAINNRLETLRDAGKLNRERGAGKSFVYFRATT